MSADLGIIFELQWKKKPGGNNREDVVSIGIWDTPDSSLDWMTFKSYVCQNLGTTEDIYVAYVDSDGDELPIESECEFQEALKFARQRASKGKEVVLKVDKSECRMFTPSTSEPKQKEIPAARIMSDMEKDLKKRHSKPSGRFTSKLKATEKLRNSTSQVPFLGEGEEKVKEKKTKTEDHSISHELGKKLACIMKLETEKRKKSKIEKDDSPPAWFKKYMQKFKSELVAEVTNNVMYNTRQLIENTKGNIHSTPSSCCCERNSGSSPITKSKKKKTSDDDSSDCALSSGQRDHKLLKKIEKLHKREKKLEKKLDSKLEKLENKTKRRMEKKSQSKSCTEQPSEKKPCSGVRKRMSDAPVGTYLMDAIPLNELKPAEVHIKLGEQYTKVWQIMNNGTLPWTDKTELRLAWGTSGLETKATILKCPILMPGEKGDIAVTFRAPEFPGTFESYWHFYHMGDRFGHWLGCAIIVDAKEPEKQENVCDFSPSKVETLHNDDNDEECKTKADQPVDLRMKCEPEQIPSTTVPTTLSDLDSTYERINKENNSAELVVPETEQGNPEYESDSDEENLSVISGPISLTSDSEDDENFVVVPMPACFMCDVPLEKSDANSTNVVKEPVDNAMEQETKIDLIEMSNSIKPDDTDDVNTGCKTSEEQNEAEDARQTFHSFSSSLNDEPLIDEIHDTVSGSSNVYAVDMAGHCMPVNLAWTSHNTSSGRNDSTEDTFSGNPPQNDPEHFCKHSKKEESKEHSKGTSFHEFHHTHTAGPFHMNFSSNGNGQVFGTAFECHSESSSNKTHQHHETQTSSTKSSHSSTPNQHQDPRGAAVHILPETLVNGAINVASQAFTTARAVLSNLRSRPSEDFAEWHWNDSAANWSAQSDRSTTESLKILLEMGFTNKILNVLLLQRYDNDIAKVVAELLTYKDY